jgi:hypothetical protein
MHDRASSSAIMTVNAAAKTNSIMPVVTRVCEMMRRNVGVYTSLTELLVRVQAKLLH